MPAGSLHVLISDTNCTTGSVVGTIADTLLVCDTGALLSVSVLRSSLMIGTNGVVKISRTSRPSPTGAFVTAGHTADAP